MTHHKLTSVRAVQAVSKLKLKVHCLRWEADDLSQKLSMAETEMSGRGNRFRSILSAGWGSFVYTTFEYNTPKIVHIKNKKVGILNRLVQLAILGYVIV